ncbi:hypothetical protein FNV43_RR23853 [Rhamnella rubrinervis]|uniref:Growth-regulating factor n=1 Tax=Rhamnella rubrinervis TaxID=2594499 RepID=A0A8K0DQ27_9ROSA|nr:hypothetical protein FNV43_RR23853 [Rhamnella rubrinervis]
MSMEIKFGVPDKEAEENHKSDNLGLGGSVNLQSTESLPSKSTMRMMMLHHDNHHHRPFPSSETDQRGDHGPTCNRAPVTDDIYDVAASRAAASVVSSVAAVGSALQPFDISTTSSTSTHTAFKFPGGMAATLGLPFTNAQWKELERQALIYKYMVASVPVPPDLLLPITRNLSSPASSQYPRPVGALGSDFSLRLSSNTDLEPGRCKRTDGKKWRCSRDVAPDQKYCERHMHRGRPRSRKHVEVHVNNANKRTRHDHLALPTTPSATMSVSSPTINNNGSQTQFLGSPALQYHQCPVFLDKSSSIKTATLQPATSLPSDKEASRSLDCMMKTEPVAMTASSDPQWHHLMRTKMELSSKTFCDANSSVFSQHSEAEPFLNLNSYANFNTGEEQQESECALFLNPDMLSLENHPAHAVAPRSFIDAWSNSTITNKSCVASTGQLSPSSLTLSMGGHNSINDEISQTRMASGYNSGNSKPHITSWLTPASWVAPQPGGPLAEVLRPSSVTGTASASAVSSPINGKGDSGSPVGTAVSSPSGVLHKTLASLSDSSGSSSPTVGSSKAKAEIALL